MNSPRIPLAMLYLCGIASVVLFFVDAPIWAHVISFVICGAAWLGAELFE